MNWEGRSKLLHAENRVIVDWATAMFEEREAERQYRPAAVEAARIWREGCEAAARTMYQLRHEGKAA